MTVLDKNKYSALIEEIGNDNVKMILRIFLEELNEYKLLMDNVTDFKTIFETMHKMKSTAISVGALTLAEQAITTEKKARENNPEAYSNLKVVLLEIEKTTNACRSIIEDSEQQKRYFI